MAAAYPRWMLAHLQRTERDPECYQVFLIEEVGDVRQAPPLSWPYRRHGVDTPAQWAARRGAVVEG